MPIYGYKCSRCGNVFEKVIKSRAQADCKCAIPNIKRATCPKCAFNAERDYSGTNICAIHSSGPFAGIGLLGEAKPDPAFDGKPSINAGKNYGLVVTIKSSEEIEISGERVDIVFLDDTECSCEFCHPKEHKPTPGELLQKHIDDSLTATMMIDGDKLHVDHSRQTHDRAIQVAMQKAMNGEYDE